MAKCEDYPCCGHTDGLPCDWTYTDEARAFDIEHAYCDHENGICETMHDQWDDEPECEDDHECDDCNGPGGIWDRDGNFTPHPGQVWHCAWCDRPCPDGAHD